MDLLEYSIECWINGNRRKSPSGGCFLACVPGDFTAGPWQKPVPRNGETAPGVLKALMRRAAPCFMMILTLSDDCIIGVRPSAASPSQHHQYTCCHDEKQNIHLIFRLILFARG
jgi:hypothetical protein